MSSVRAWGAFRRCPEATWWWSWRGWRSHGPWNGSKSSAWIEQRSHNTNRWWKAGTFLQLVWPPFSPFSPSWSPQNAKFMHGSVMRVMMDRGRRRQSSAKMSSKHTEPVIAWCILCERGLVSLPNSMPNPARASAHVATPAPTPIASTLYFQVLYC